MFSLPPLPRTLAACRRDLESEKDQVRVSVARDLGRRASDAERQEQIELLHLCLDDRAAAVRKQALVSVADIEGCELRDRLLSALCDAELEVRQLAVVALGEVARSDDEEVLGRLASLLNAGAAAVRYQALLAYSNLRPESCEGDLIAALSDEDAEIRRLALRLIDEVFLGAQVKLGERTNRTVLSACNDDDAHVSLLAQLVCGELRLDAPRARLLEVVDRRLKVLEPRDEQWAIELCGRLSLFAARPGLRRRAYGVLGWSSDPFRWVALGALARLGEEEALTRLLRQLGSRNYMQRVLAVDALGRSARPEALRALSEHRFRLAQESGPRPEDEKKLVDDALGHLETEVKDAI